MSEPVYVPVADLPMRIDKPDNYASRNGLADLGGALERARNVAVQLEQDAAHLTAGLREIAGLCLNSNRSDYNCKTMGRDRTSQYLADCWCDQCIAMDTLGEL